MLSLLNYSFWVAAKTNACDKELLIHGFYLNNDSGEWLEVITYLGSLQFIFLIDYREKSIVQALGRTAGYLIYPENM